ncbi:DUF5009 domain-containing protein [Bacteroides thetaiotaomicron]|nr:DUF5009 domain-containing protein [Bacteroides thetaiotaomicron]
MSHAQTPPPDHIFQSFLPGITGVDLVFPSLPVYSNGSSPFSIGKRARER